MIIQKKRFLMTFHWFIMLIACLTFTLTLWGTWRAQVVAKHQFTWHLGLLSAGLSLLLVGIVWLLTHWLNRRGDAALWLTFAALIVIKIIAIRTIPTWPTSDFWNYHYFAALSANGMSWVAMSQHHLIANNFVFPHVLNIAAAFSLPEAIFGANYGVLQIANTLVIFVSMLVIVKIGQRLKLRSLGIAVALGYYWLPAYWLYTLIDGAEPLFIGLLLIATLALLNVIMPPVTSYRNDQIMSLLMAVVAATLANALRPIVVIWLIAILIFSSLARSSSVIHRRQRLILGFMTVITVMSLTLVGALTPKFYGITIAPDRVSQAYSVATGTDPATNGAYSTTVRAVLDRHISQMSRPKASAKADQTAIDDLNRLTKQHLRQLNQKHDWPIFMRNKITAFLDEDYGFDWIDYNFAHHTKIQRAQQRQFFKQSDLLTLWSTFCFSGLLVVPLVGELCLLFWPQLRRRLSSRQRNLLLFNNLLFLGFFYASLLVEVQGRYHIVLYLPLLTLTSLVIQNGGAMIRPQHQH
ncbi:hypothetical protein [Furfurilactobacillus curtus]|uniref:Glycosyltransferase RgtA/B/C/D-like domain-containing protein n=1 Tax=Furfurilactobacillus curtus TaxID=1746200 RepID=A0ABQ5JMR5_9LACO